MKFISLPIKNITGNIGRSITFGSFLFFATLTSIILICYIMTVRENFEDSLINAITGHIQIRSSGSEEDMGAMNITSDKLENLKYLT